MLIMSSCCCQPGQSCDIHFNPFDDADLSAYTLWNCGPNLGTTVCDTLNANTASGRLFLDPDSPLLTGALTYQANIVDDPPDTFVRFVSSQVRTEQGPAGVCIGVPYGWGNDTDPVSFPQNEPWAALWWDRFQARQEPSVSGCAYDETLGIVLLAWGVGNTLHGASVVKWGVEPIGVLEDGPALRLEIHGPPSTGIYDLHCYVDNLLCHIECDVELLGYDTAATHIGLAVFHEGDFEYLCIGRDYESQTRYCTHTPNQYTLRLYPADTAGVDAESPCFGFSASCSPDADNIADADPAERWVEWWLRKRFGDATTCVFESFALSDIVGVSDRNPFWELTITETATDTYHFSLRWITADITSFGDTAQIVWDETFSPYPSGDVELTYNEAASDCELTGGLETITLTKSECGVIQDGGVRTGCCPDNTLPAVLTPTVTLPGSAGANYTSGLENINAASGDGGTEAEGWAHRLTITQTIAPFCTNTTDVVLYCDVPANGAEGFRLSVEGLVGSPISPDTTSESCDPFYLKFTWVDPVCGINVEFEYTE